jgi:hypothetical protein
MSVDKHTLQKWVTGAELRLKKSAKPFAKVPLVNRIKQVAKHTLDYSFVEKIDLTRARNFRAQESAEDFLFASIQLPVLGKQAVGNDVGMAVASFDYTDRDGDKHQVIAICAYTVSGVVKKHRELNQTILIPMA